MFVSNIIRMNKPTRLRWGGLVARMEEGRRAFKILTGTPTGKRPLGRPRLSWEDNIWNPKVTKIGSGGGSTMRSFVVCIQYNQGRLIKSRTCNQNGSR